MPLQGFGVGAVNGKAPETEEQGPNFQQLVTDEHRLAERLAPARVLRRWKSSAAPQRGTGGSVSFQLSGTSYIVNTDQDKINALQVTVLSGTLWVFLQEAEASGSEIPDYVFGTMTPLNPIIQPIPLDRYCLTFYAKSADCQYAVIGVAL